MPEGLGTNVLLYSITSVLHMDPFYNVPFYIVYILRGEVF